LQIVWTLVLTWVGIFSLLGFILMGVDKWRAGSRHRRIPERTLFAIAFVGGAFGVVLGSFAFNHKTRKDSFNYVTYLAVAVWIALLLEAQNVLMP